MKTFIKNNKYFLILIIISSSLLGSCDKKDENIKTFPTSGEVQFKVELMDKDGNHLADVGMEIYAKERLQEDYILIHEGKTDENGLLIVDDLAFPNMVRIEVVDTKYPYSQPIIVKSFGEGSAFASMVINTDWDKLSMADRTGWTVIETSSVQGGGVGQRLLDGNEESIWHSQYSPVSYDYPHYFVVDMKQEKTMSGLAYKNRSVSNGPIKGIEVLVSDDGIVWESLGNFQLEDDGMAGPSEWQIIKLDVPAKGRYVKTIAKSSWLPIKFCNLAEFGVY